MKNTQSKIAEAKNKKVLLLASIFASLLIITGCIVLSTNRAQYASAHESYEYIHICK